MAGRIKGQEVEVVVIVDGEPQGSFGFARNVSFTFMTQRLEEGYLGETTNRFDTIFNGVSGSTEHHHDSAIPLQLVRTIVDKARQRTPGVEINMRATLNYPNGQRARIVFRAVEFGELPFSFGGRSEYGTFSLDFACSDAQILPL